MLHEVEFPTSKRKGEPHPVPTVGQNLVTTHALGYHSGVSRVWTALTVMGADARLPDDAATADYSRKLRRSRLLWLTLARRPAAGIGRWTRQTTDGQDVRCGESRRGRRSE
ncbi:unnamed protein product [Heligmosomoides polygyrus]|uniref:Beta-lactamase domain-containing protein n=1 Tax=Heligmosomoides polygyrus TaxID=6339 RepID=A0A183GHL7_HELPZ|nr:unnamed protein product [Heligmosomoides polygyrus]